MTAINRPPHTAAIQGIMVIASIREVRECLVYLTSWLLCRPRGPLTLRGGRGRREGTGVVLRIQIYTQQVWWILFDWEGKLKLGWENKAVRSSVPLLNQTFAAKWQWHRILPSWILSCFFYCFLGPFCLIFLWNIAWKLLRIKFTQLSILQRDVCVAAEAQLLFVFTQTKTHTDVIARPMS